MFADLRLDRVSWLSMTFCEKPESFDWYLLTYHKIQATGQSYIYNISRSKKVKLGKDLMYHKKVTTYCINLKLWPVLNP